MTRYASCSLLLALCLVTTQTRGDDAKDAFKDAMKKLEGTWVVASWDLGKEGFARLVGSDVSISGGKLTFHRPKQRDDELQYSIKLDPTKTPKTIDLKSLALKGKEQVSQGIYELEGDTLKICQQHKVSEPRPTKFESKGDTISLLVLKRVKK